MRRLLVLTALILCGLAGLGSAQAGMRSSAPPGATARCQDGTYSYSKHRSGTCSHYGGVADWLSGGSQASGGSSGQIALGRTVLLRLRTRTGDCTLAALPDRRCSPGAYYSGLSRSTLCSASFQTSSIRHVTESSRHAVEEEYGLGARSYGRTIEVDHIVPLELGGSNDYANLYPEQARPSAGGPGYAAKDRLENAAHRLVCRGSISLRTAQREIAANWEHFYTRVFGTAPRS